MPTDGLYGRMLAAWSESKNKHRLTKLMLRPADRSTLRQPGEVVPITTWPY